METRQDLVEEMIKKAKDNEGENPVFINEIAMPIAKLQEVDNDDMNK